MQEMSDRRKQRCDRIRAAIVLESALLLVVGVIFFEHTGFLQNKAVETTAEGTIKWVDFNVSYEALCKAYEYDVESYGKHTLIPAIPDVVKEINTEYKVIRIKNMKGLFDEN